MKPSQLELPLSNSEMHFRYLTKEEVAQKVLQVSVRTVNSWMKAGKLPFLRIGRTVRFRLSDIQQFLDTNCRVERK